MPNRLAQETSPYLRQHADNPVDWYPWGEEALTLARREDKPILLSVGYSACHWCHVMAHESFEDAGIAAEMNRLFVNIKVDREERPDLDQIYQTSHYLLTRRSGGWPLTLFLTPDTTPYAGGTYFPKTPRYGMPGFKEVLGRAEQLYRTRRADIERQNVSLLGALASTVPDGAQADAPDAAALDAALAQLAERFDAADGGFGQAPKFPHSFELEFLLRRYAAGDARALPMVRHTLTRMAEGGIYDQLGGGFCRYSVDGSWTIPHFEKMLYDNGPLLALYADAWRVTRDPLFARIAEQTAQWVMRDMQAPQGGYYSSLDADSEHHECKFYVWTPEAVRALLSDDEYAVLAPHYGLDHGPNFEGRFWHLRVSAELEQVARSCGLSLEDCRQVLDRARAKLLAARDQRVWPGRDEKLLTSWNALMIRGMARAARALERPEWLDSARRALRFIRTTLWHDGRLFATHKDGKTHLNAYLDDYAFLLDAVLEVMQAEFDPVDLRFAQDLAEGLLDRFEDPRDGGFFFTSHDHERLIHRPKAAHDNATPSGNGVAAYALQRLGYLIGEPRYLGAATRTLALFAAAIGRQASAFPSLLNALAEHLQPTRTVVLCGPADQLGRWRTVLRGGYRPNTLCLTMSSPLDGLPPALAKPFASTVNAWVCEGVSCLAPIDDPEVLGRTLDGATER